MPKYGTACPTCNLPAWVTPDAADLSRTKLLSGREVRVYEKEQLLSK